MSLKLIGYGHPNISARHLTTIEFTSSSDVSPRGDCIVACKVRFDVKELQKLLSAPKLKIKIVVGHLSDEVECTPNHAFNDSSEIVLRMSSVATHRTFGIKANKGAGMLKRELVEMLKNSEQIAEITIEEEP